jgi:hypothetical protein
MFETVLPVDVCASQYQHFHDLNTTVTYGMGEKWGPGVFVVYIRPTVDQIFDSRKLSLFHCFQELAVVVVMISALVVVAAWACEEIVVCVVVV